VRVVVIARLSATPETREELLRRARAMLEPTQAESGCVSYRLYQELVNENELVFVEEWESREVLEAHFHTGHFVDFEHALDDLLTAGDVVAYHVEYREQV
jgi:quinol monooxygenase YgiN